MKFLKNLTLNQSFLNVLIVLTLTLLGVFLRYLQISPYKFYPDAYQNLIVAKNITSFQSVIGTLGDNGLVYPPFFEWTRPVYPLLISLFDGLIHNPELSAQIISFLAGVLFIPLSYFLGKMAFSSQKHGLIAAFLAAVSMNHTVWSGYIMSDTTGILFSSLYWISIFKLLSRKAYFLEPWGLLSGFLLALSFFTRYEYLLFAFPTVLLLLKPNEHIQPFFKLLNISLAFIITALIVLALLFPIIPTLETIYRQFSDLITKVIIFIPISIIVFFLARKIKLANFTPLSFIVYALGFIALILPILKIQIPKLPGLSNFIVSDLFIFFFAFLGIGLMLSHKKQQKLALISLISLILMTAIYFRANPLQQRYFTHLIPILILGASYSINYLTEKARKKSKLLFFVIIATIFIFTLRQINLSFWGIKQWNQGDWTKVSYEEQSAKLLKAYLEGDEIIVTALPEPYYYFTKHSTISINEKTSLLPLQDVPLDKELIIVNDQGLRDLFPTFSQQIETKYHNYKVAEYKVEENYHFGTKTIVGNGWIILYKLTVSNFQNP